MPSTRHKQWIPRLALAALLVSASALAWREGVALDSLLEQIHAAERMGLKGRALFFVLYIAAALLLLPASLLTIGAGAVFGFVEGVALVSLSSTVAATCAFLTSRWLLGGLLDALTKRSTKFHALEKAIELEGLRAVFLIRLSPLFPYNITNYALGATRLKTSRFLLGSWVGMLPGTIVYVWLGTAAIDFGESLTTERELTAGQLALLFVGTCATFLVGYLIARRARDQFNSIVNAHPGGEEE